MARFQYTSIRKVTLLQPSSAVFTHLKRVNFGKKFQFIRRRCVLKGYPWSEGTSDRPTGGSYNLHQMKVNLEICEDGRDLIKKVKVKGYIRGTQAMRPKAEQNNFRKQNSY